MTGQPMEVSAIDQAREFERAVWDCDRVLVEKKNALGEYDVHVVPGAIARLSMPIPKPDKP